MRKSKIISLFFLRNISHAISSNCIPNVGLKSHNPAPNVFFFQSRVYPPPPPPPPPPLSHIHTYIPIFLYITLLLPKWPTLSILYNQYTQSSIFVMTKPPPPLLQFCTPPYPYLYLWPPLTTYIHLFLYLRLFLSVLI